MEMSVPLLTFLWSVVSIFLNSFGAVLKKKYLGHKSCFRSRSCFRKVNMTYIIQFLRRKPCNNLVQKRESWWECMKRKETPKMTNLLLLWREWPSSFCFSVRGCRPEATGNPGKSKDLHQQGICLRQQCVYQIRLSCAAIISNLQKSMTETTKVYLLLHHGYLLEGHSAPCKRHDTPILTRYTQVPHGKQEGFLMYAFTNTLPIKWQMTLATVIHHS